MNISVLDAETLRFPPQAWRAISELGNLTLHDNTSHQDERAIIRNIGDAEVVLTNKVPLNASILKQLPKLELISVLATGYNIVDTKAAKAQGVTVCNVPSYSTQSTAQHTVALILECCNEVGRHAQSVSQGDWVRSPIFSYWFNAPRELSQMKVGIVGFGTIGRQVATALHAMGAHISAFARTPRDTPSWEKFEWADIPTIFRECDIVSLHCPQTQENLRFVNEALLNTMKPTAFLINTARGTLIDETALATALKNKAIAGAALDVVSTEPMQAENPLLDAPNCYITPHIAWASLESRQALLKITAENIQAFYQQKAINVVG